jgi:hypothetical protein
MENIIVLKIYSQIKYSINLFLQLLFIFSQHRPKPNGHGQFPRVGHCQWPTGTGCGVHRLQMGASKGKGRRCWWLLGALGKDVSFVGDLNFEFFLNVIDSTNRKTNEQGRIPVVHPGENLTAGDFKLHFHTKEYFQKLGQSTFYPYIEALYPHRLIA